MSDDPIRTDRGADPPHRPDEQGPAGAGLRAEVDRARATVREETARTRETLREEATRTAETVRREAARTTDTVRREAVRTKETAQREAARTKETMADAREQLRRSMADAVGPPAEDEEQAERQLADLRARIEHDLDTLRARVPDVRELGDRAKKIGLVVGATGVVLVGATSLRRRRSSRRAEQERLRTQAVALARELARLEAEETGADDSGRGSSRWLWLGLGAAAGLASWIAQQRRADTPDEDPAGPRGEPSTVEVTVEAPSDTSPRPR